jgi:hypothetical protein
VIQQTTEQVRATFGIPTDQVVKDAVKGLYGKAPNDVFYNDPTSWKDANYAVYGWPPLQLRLVPLSAQVTDPKITAAQIAVAEFPNNTGAPIEGEFDDIVDRTNTSQTKTALLEAPPSDDAGADLGPMDVLATDVSALVSADPAG